MSTPTISRECWAVVFGSGAIYLYDDYALAKKIADGMTKHTVPVRVRVESLPTKEATNG